MSTSTKTETPPTNGSDGKPLGTSTAMVIGSDAYRVALEPVNPDQAYKFAELMASGGAWGSLPEIMGKIAMGRTLGLPWMVALQKIHLIKGMFAVAADTLHALCLSKAVCEYFEPVLAECNAEKATFVTKRVGRPEQKYVYTIEDAELMGVVDRGKDDKAKSENNWVKVRKQMLLARCKSILARLIYPDLTQGIYAFEELSGEGSIDPNEIAGVILTQAEAAKEAATGRVISVQVAPRDFAKEAEELKVKIRASGPSRQAAAEVREAIAAWDGIEPYKSQVAAFYNEVREERKKAAPATAQADAAAAPAGTAANPAPIPEGGLFASGADKGDGK